MAEALGVPLYRPQRFFPSYRNADSGSWRIIDCPFHLEPGYVSALWAVAGLPMLLRQTGQPPRWDTWMSITPHEIESQELGCDHAFGHTVIMGLGMGWIAANVALRAEVTRVTVVELDPDVIALIEQLDCFATLPAAARAKINIVHADALEWRPEPSTAAVDFLFADIWLTLDEQDTVEQVRRMQANISAQSIYFWGQEMALYRALEERQRNMEGVSNAELRVIADTELGLPLLIPADLDYAALIDSVVAKRKTRGLYPPAWAK
jgi:hypothetical protein